MTDISKLTVHNQFNQTDEEIFQQMKLFSLDSYDQMIYDKSSFILPHMYQLYHIDEVSSVSDPKSSSRRPTKDVSSISASLDPTDWPATRAEAHKMLDVSLDFLENARDRPVWTPLPSDVRHRLSHESLPKDGKSIAEVCKDIVDDVLPYSGGNTHPRFWGWVHGSGTVGGVIAEMMTATMNSNVGLCSHSGVLIERQVIEWMRQLFEFPSETAGGVIVSGTSMASVICLAVARYNALNKVRQEGLVTLGVRLVAYSSTQTHVCIAKALELLGLGSEALRQVPVDEQYRMDIEMLKKMIEEDRQQGLTPFCIVGNAGMSKQYT
jgi:hypothetical protein